VLEGVIRAFDQYQDVQIGVRARFTSRLIEKLFKHRTN
jgi:hypothetical protein